MAVAVTEPNLKAMLRAYQQEREAWLSHAHKMLEQDARVVAAWLFGSQGRGTADELSDVDLFIVLADDCAHTVMNARQQHIAALQTPLLILDAPQNRPPHGAYTMALYDGQFGPHQVDWYWQPHAQAKIPAETRLLFDRANLPRSEQPTHFEYQPVPERTKQEALAQTIRFFWVMLLIAAKHAARQPDNTEAGLLSYPLSSLREVRAFLKETIDLPFADNLSDLNFGAKLRLMRALAGDMEHLTPLLNAQGIPVPAKIAPSAYRYFDFIEAVGSSSEP